MAVDAGFPARLASLIQEERRGLQGFIALLKREEALLIATQIDALSALAQEAVPAYAAWQADPASGATLTGILQRMR